jgi:hypothetical protein
MSPPTLTQFFAFQCRLFSVIFSMSSFLFFNVAFVVQCRLFIFSLFMHEKWIVYPTLSPSIGYRMFIIHVRLVEP